jgi:GTP-binding protein
MPLPVKFIKSAVFPADFPKPDRPEIALAGRSNAGKSSFLNAVTNSKIAKVSQEPGKTRLLNFFDVGQHYRFVDMPGYGFASRSGDEMRTWSQMVQHYLQSRENLAGLLLLMDIRRDWAEEEDMLCEFMSNVDKPILLIGTKVDRCAQKELRERTKALESQTGGMKLWPMSSLKMTGVKEIENHFFTEWIKPNLKGARKSNDEA